jgi:RNA polymerase sigma-70 factor, ECF subfamily
MAHVERASPVRALLAPSSDKRGIAGALGASAEGSIGGTLHSTASLLQRLQHRDESALRLLYHTYNRMIYAFAMARLRNNADAEEVAIDTIHEVWRRPASFRGESKFTTWLLGIARHKILSVIGAREPAHEDVNTIEDSLACDEPSAFEVVAHKQREHNIRVCMNQLPDRDKQCLQLRFYEGRSLREVAEIQQCSENAVKTRLFRARRKLKQCPGLWSWRTH